MKWSYGILNEKRRSPEADALKVRGRGN